MNLLMVVLPQVVSRSSLPETRHQGSDLPADPSESLPVRTVLREGIRLNLCDQVAQLLSAEWLLEHSRDPELLQDGASLPGPGRDDHHAQPDSAVRMLVEPPDDVLAAHPRHAQVEEHEVERPLLKRRHCLD